MGAAGLVGRTAWSSEAGLTQWLWRHLQSSCAASNLRPWSRRLSTRSWDIFISWMTDSAGVFWRTESRLGSGRLQISSHPWHRSREESRSRGRAAVRPSSWTVGLLADGAGSSLEAITGNSLEATIGSSAGAVCCSLVGLGTGAVAEDSVRVFWEDGMLSDV